ncbi:MAG: OadG family transporter subunit [Pseudomonadota bacterium]|nr:OadG family transporter subunit [Pseudomonadota bacterium]
MSNLLWEGVNLMMIGMGAVFVFLVLLVFATSIMSALISKLLPEPNISSTPTATGHQPPQASDGQLMAVIAAAIHRHRSRHK